MPIHDAVAVSSAIQTGDSVFESLYRLNRPVVYAYALSRLRNPSDAEDVTQTTFLNAYRALHSGVAPRNDLQWLLAIARNLCRDSFRDARRRAPEEPLDDLTPAVQPDGTDYSVGEICKQIAELHPRHRQILLMREFEGRSYAEISAQLGVSESAVQALLTRARRKLRDELELGITCPQARRISLRHLNGVAARDERRALQRHLRRCGDCAVFVGGRPRTALAYVLWLPTLPFRKLGALLLGTSSAPVGTAAGGGGALAMKVLTVTAIGSTAVGVTVKEVTAPANPRHAPIASRAQPAPARAQSPHVRVQPAAVDSRAARRAPARRAPLTHASARTERPSGTAADGSASRAIVALPPAPGPAPAASADATPTARELPDPDPAAAAEPDAVVSTEAAGPPPAAGTTAPAADTAAVTPLPAQSTATSPPADDASAPASPGATPPPTPPPAQSTATSPPTDDASAPASTGATPPPTPPVPAAEAAPPIADASGDGSNGNAFGRGGTPPGHDGAKHEGGQGRDHS